MRANSRANQFSWVGSDSGIITSDRSDLILGDREFGSVKLGSGICDQQVKLVFMVKQERYIQQRCREYIHL
jgi:hypothetical protein